MAVSSSPDLPQRDDVISLARGHADLLSLWPRPILTVAERRLFLVSAFAAANRRTSIETRPLCAFAEGELLAGRYRVLSLLGRGWNGRSVRSRRYGAERDVALKTIAVGAAF